MYRPEKLDSRDDFTTDNLRSAAIVVFGCPRERFTSAEFETLKRYVRHGGSVLVMLSEGGEGKAGTNINYWLEEYGIAINNDAVVRTTHYKYLHPKEVRVGDLTGNLTHTQTQTHVQTDTHTPTCSAG